MTEDDPTENQPRRKPNLQRSMAVIKFMFGIFAVAMLLLVGGLFLAARDRDSAIERVEEALAQFEADRIDRSVNACEDRNAIRIGMNQLVLNASGHDDTGNPTDRFLAATPEQQARAVDLLSKLLPLQVCNTDAIDLYVTSGRTQGIIPIDGSDGSYSEAVSSP